MIRRRLVHAMLALVLLISQQMALSHAMAHWSDARSAVAASEQGKASRLAKAFAQAQSCDQCLAFAQIATALGDAPRSVAALDTASVKADPVAGRSDRPRHFNAFHSRAPPVTA